MGKEENSFFMDKSTIVNFFKVFWIVCTFLKIFISYFFVLFTAFFFILHLAFLWIFSFNKKYGFIKGKGSNNTVIYDSLCKALNSMENWTAEKIDNFILEFVDLGKYLDQRCSAFVRRLTASPYI